MQPFRSYVEEDEARSAGASPATHRLAATLTEQRRMHPAIAEIVSHAFYRDQLKTAEARIVSAHQNPVPVQTLPPLPNCPVVVVDFEHVSDTGKARELEKKTPAWNNPNEVDAVMDVLRLCRPLGRTSYYQLV